MKKVTFTKLEPNTNAILGTSRQGYIIATRAQIESVFGTPTWNTPSADEKITTEWAVVFDTKDEDDIVATIYDWKRYEQGAPEMDEQIVWNIGGRRSLAASKVAEALQVFPFVDYPFHQVKKLGIN